MYIDSAAQLAYIRDHWNEVSDISPYAVDKEFSRWSYKLRTDIDMGDWSWTPLGSESFKGTFYGNGHTIRINISGASDNYQGLFASIAEGGRVENLHVSGNIHCSDSRLVGGIAGENNGTIANCWVSADVRSDWKESWSAYTAKVGGIAGENNGTVEYCCMTGNVKNDDADVGGLVGDNSDGTVSHSTFYGTHSSSHSQYNAFVGCHGTETDLHTDYNEDEYTNASNNSMYRNALQEPFAINISNAGNGSYVAKIGEATVTRARPGQTVTLTRMEGTVHGITIKDADGNTITSTGDMNTSLTITMPRRNVNVTAIFYTTDWDSDDLGTEQNPYIINIIDEWNAFATRVNGGKTFSGKFVKLTADISVESQEGVENMVGRHDGPPHHPFSGHFDGGGNTIHCQIAAIEGYVAPFRHTENATFKNLTLTGSVSIVEGKRYDLGGIVANAKGTTTFTNCKVSSLLRCDDITSVTVGGFVGSADEVSFNNCVFDGKLRGGDATNCGGFVGWFITSATLNNCLFNPSEMTINSASRCTFVCKDEDAAFSNCYYTQSLGTAQGWMVYATEPSPGFYTPVMAADGNTYYAVIGTESGSGTTKTYQITENIDVTSRIIVKGTVELTLDEGATLHARKGIELSADNNANLTIDGLGALTIDGCNKGKSGIGSEKVGTLVIDGGTITTSGGQYAAGIGGDYASTSGGSITINGGVVNARGGSFSAAIGGATSGSQNSPCGDIVINGGQVTAMGNTVYGVGPGITSGSGYQNGSLTLGWTSQDDFVYISNCSNDSYSSWSLSSITIAEGKTLYDEDGGEHSSGSVGNIYGKTLRPYDYCLVLSNDADNGEAIDDANGKVYNVTLANRTLFKDGNWNTLCLPFDVTVGSGQMAGATAMTLNASQSGFDATSGELSLYFDNMEQGSTIAAGTPFIVKWTGDDVTNPVFSGVTVLSTEAGYVLTTDGNVRFQGTYSPTVIYSADHDNLFLGKENMLYWPSTEGYTMGACRAYFHVDLNGGQAAVRQFVLHFGEEQTETTGLDNGAISSFDDSSDNGQIANGQMVQWYDLQGRRISVSSVADATRRVPTGLPKGLYINNGKKVVIK